MFFCFVLYLYVRYEQAENIVRVQEIVVNHVGEQRGPFVAVTEDSTQVHVR
jgi:hypothetical protein